jgi:hypothetical protein
VRALEFFPLWGLLAWEYRRRGGLASSVPQAPLPSRVIAS